MGMRIATPRGRVGKPMRWVVVLRSFAISVSLLAFGSSALAVNVNVDGQVIADGSFWDMDPTPNAVSFDSNDPLQGFATASGIDAKGDVVLAGPGGALASILPTGPRLVLTNFVADWWSNTLGPGPHTFQITFDHTFATMIPGVVTAADAVAAFQNDGSGLAIYFPGGSPVAAGQDNILAWQGYVNSIPIPTPFGPTPAIPNPPGLGNAYPVYGHGASVMNILPGALIQPTLVGDLTFSLGGPRNQFVLNSSAEVGFIPEPATGLLVAAGLAGLGVLRRRKS
jgi:hypothetical protein